MGESNLNVDPALLTEFIDESQDTLGALDAQFVALEANPQDLSIVEAIFRPVHSIKGNSGFFGFIGVKKLAHELETLLDHVRKGRLTVNAQITDVLLRGTDELRQMFARVRESQDEVADQAAYAALIKRVQETASEQPNPLGFVLEELKAAVARADREPASAADSLRALHAAVEQHIAQSGGGPRSAAAASPSTAPAAPACPRSTALLDKLSQPIGGTLPTAEAEAIGRELRMLRQEAPNEAARAILDQAIENYDTFADTVGFDDLLRELTLEKLQEYSQAASSSAAPESSAQPTAGAKAPAPKPTAPAAAADGAARDKHADPGKTMRVSEAHIDTFLEYVGELLVVADMFSNLQQQLAASDIKREIAQRFKHANATFGALSQSLQKSIMSIRKVSMRGLLQKVPRLVRDIAADHGKEISVEVTGDTTEVDKSLIDLLDAPLTHMVRNAADHGVEKPEARAATGKPRTGIIRVSVVETDNHIVLEVSDDGAGLNLDKIRAKGESLGVIRPGQQMTQTELVNLIFSSGLSTAEKVTDVSGRGVGMDVVKRMIEDSGGVITIDTEAGKGSRFTLKLPKSVTTQIMPGYLVEVAGRKYVLPMNKVRETASVAASACKTITGKGRCVVRHGAVLPLVTLRGLFGQVEGEHTDQVIVVTVEAGHERYAVAVDNVLGVQQVVLREIEGLEIDTDLVAGGALMGDGSVALVVNPEVLCRTHSRRAA